ncbi:hypothetical protein ABEB36_010571 [Hypothenemus hampei]|uniref:F-box domain-containing protein n=1 Tax=Hypothenemus hampei TaxID=57062 RepID=A0ABD1EN54_HYPHA
MAQQGVLQPVDVNIDYSPARKRARVEDQGNEDSKYSHSNGDLDLNEVLDFGIGRLDCDSQDVVVSEDDTIFTKTVPIGVDVSCASLTPDSREKQVSILESTLTKESLDKISIGEWSYLLSVNKPSIKPESLINYFDLLCDEVILYILKWIPKTSLKNVALCCKRLYRLSNDETLWTRLDISNKRLSPGKLGYILSKQVVVLRLARSKIIPTAILPGCRAFEPDFQSRLLYLDLSMTHIATRCLTELFNKCKRLKKLSLENVAVNNEVLIALSGNIDIEVINFAMCTGIQEDGLKYLLRNCRHVRELNIAWTNLSQPSIRLICDNLSSTMDRLNISGCKKMMTDSHVASLVSSCPKLRELDLSDCTNITRDTMKYIRRLENLTFIALSRCYMIPSSSILLLKKLKNLSYLDIHGGYIADHELKQIHAALGNAVQINQFKFSSVARPTVGLRRSSIWNMRVKD